MRHALGFALLLLSACEPKGKPVELPAEALALPRVDRFSEWDRKAAELAGVEELTQTWARAQPFPEPTGLAEALYAELRAIELGRACLNEGTDDCKGQMDRKAESVMGFGSGLLWRRRLCDALNRKAELLLALGHAKYALAAADESIVYGDHPYNHKVRGDALYALGRFQDAHDAYLMSATTLKGEGPYLKFLRGLCKLRLGQKDEGAALTAEGLAGQPELRTDVEGADKVMTEAGL